MSDPAKTATPTPAQIVQQAAADYLKITNAPGCCIAVYDENAFGTTGYAYPLGNSGVAGSSPAPFSITTDTVFELGSVTKLFTATLLAVQVVAGGSFLSDNVGYWLNYNQNFGPNPIGSSVLDAI